jgi:hypothetical protein
VTIGLTETALPGIDGVYKVMRECFG